MGFHDGVDLSKGLCLLLQPYLVLLPPPLSLCTVSRDHTETQTVSQGAKLCHSSVLSFMRFCCLDAFPSPPGELLDSFQAAPSSGEPP